MPAPEPGTRLSHYVIQKRIGGGGMGTVYRARDTTLDRDVAIKAINPGIGGDPDRIARFRREAKAVAVLNHPGIVTIHEQLEEHGTTYLVTEFVEGTTLRELMINIVNPSTESDQVHHPSWRPQVEIPVVSYFTPA